MRFLVASIARVNVRGLRFRDGRIVWNTRNQSVLFCQLTGKRGTRDIIASGDQNALIVGGEHLAIQYARVMRS